MPSLLVISFSVPAVSSCNVSDSTTQGPAIRKNGRPRPTSKPHNFTSTLRPHPGARRDPFWSCKIRKSTIGSGLRRNDNNERQEHSPHGLLRQPRRLAHGLELARGAHE